MAEMDNGNKGIHMFQPTGTHQQVQKLNPQN